MYLIIVIMARTKERRALMVLRNQLGKEWSTLVAMVLDIILVIARKK